jgi:Fuc2NAc and GlcNAc transferase
VTIATTLINVVFLSPIAWAVAVGRLAGWMGVVVAYVPLAALALRYKAGAREP